MACFLPFTFCSCAHFEAPRLPSVGLFFQSVILLLTVTSILLTTLNLRVSSVNRDGGLVPSSHYLPLGFNETNT